MHAPWLVATTVAHREQALALARAMVELRLAACVQLSAIDSIYRWQGAVQHDDEVRLLFKTTGDRVDALMAALRERHPYELPALHAWPTAAADPTYAAWVHESVHDPLDKA